MRNPSGRAGQVRVGDLVRIQYKGQAGNYRWSLYEMTAVYLGNGRERGHIDLSLRGQAGMGTTSLRKEHITEREVVMTVDQVSRLRDGVRDRSLPTKASVRLGPTTAP